ncbi:DMT family transporter [Lutibacter sp.]|uniref:DMT family transporter n=1 Tax=Lutibacter sp. TaxID=1925666 RepID=UPI001A2932FB|nr:DMT family transporter [Lutibacter sp.]MBI9040343.1 DMT family transporter [Lutibacter sp.]
MIKSTQKAHLALLGANIIYGANFLIAKGLMPDKIGASALVLLRVVAAGMLFWVIKQFVKEKVEKKDFILLAFCGLFGISTNMLLFFHGLSLTSPIDASIIMTATPVIVLILSAFILKEKITTNKYIGILIGGIGAIVLIVYGKSAGGTSSFLGNLFVFLNACSYGLYLVLVKPLMKKYKAITVISWVFLFGLIFVFPFGISDLMNTDLSGFTTNTYLAITFVIIGTTFFTYLFNIYALSHVPPSVNGSYIYLQPVLSFILVSLYATVFGNNEYAQDINLIKIASCILVVFGVYMISKKPKLV